MNFKRTVIFQQTLSVTQQATCEARFDAFKCFFRV